MLYGKLSLFTPSHKHIHTKSIFLPACYTPLDLGKNCQRKMVIWLYNLRHISQQIAEGRSKKILKCQEQSTMGGRNTIVIHMEVTYINIMEAYFSIFYLLQCCTWNHTCCQSSQEGTHPSSSIFHQPPVECPTTPPSFSWMPISDEIICLY